MGGTWGWGRGQRIGGRQGDGVGWWRVEVHVRDMWGLDGSLLKSPSPIIHTLIPPPDIHVPPPLRIVAPGPEHLQPVLPPSLQRAICTNKLVATSIHVRNAMLLHGKHKQIIYTILEHDTIKHV